MFGSNDNDNQQQDANNHGFIPAATPEPNNDNSGFGSPPLPAQNAVGNDVSLPALDNLGEDNASSPVAPAASGDDNDLLSIKQQALQHLSPLVGHLEQTPEEKFRTTMMMIQASDNQDMVKDAFEAAKQIADDKARAQAFLDVINEINYFTQQHNS